MTLRSRRILIAIFYLGLVAAGLVIGHWLTEIARFEVRPSNEPEIHAMVMAATAIYMLASALPFVPGAEIGFAMILMLGTRIAFLVYGAMVAALLIASLVGRFVPSRATAAAFAWLGLRRARALVLRMEPMNGDERLALLTARAPTRILPFLLRHRYIALAVALNIPGNTLIGGGGGISLAAGLSGLFSPPAFALTVALAVAPVPLVMFLTGAFVANV